jgi:hypothetical protein
MAILIFYRKLNNPTMLQGSGMIVLRIPWSPYIPTVRPSLGDQPGTILV